MITNGVFLANEISEHIFIVNAKLREDTVESFNKSSGLSLSKYSPWMCAYPCAINKPSLELLQWPPCERGDLITDPLYLTHAANFLSVPVPGMNSKPGNPEDWTPRWTRNATVESRYVEACELLRAAHPTFGRLFDELVDYIVPVGSTHQGYSSHLTRGAIFRGFPDRWNEFDIGIDIAHELGHHSLITWQSVDSILSSDVHAPVFSSIRKTQRPAIQSFHAAVALSFMLFFVDRYPDNATCQEVKTRHGKLYIGGSLEAALQQALDELDQHCTYTPVGQQMVTEMRGLLH